MRIPIPILVGLTAMAIPVAASAATAAASPAASSLVLAAHGPVQFGGPTARCPLGTATATVTVVTTGEHVSSLACAKRSYPCGAGCTRYRIVYDVPLAGGLIRSAVTQRQVSSADHRSVGVTVSGRVIRADGDYAGLLGAPENGGGALVVHDDGSVELDLTTAITPTS